jgi:hypothetical protein
MYGTNMITLNKMLIKPFKLLDYGIYAEYKYIFLYTYILYYIFYLIYNY